MNIQQATTDLRAAISPSVLVSGSVHVIDLAPIKSGAGERWERSCEHVHSRLDGILRQRLSATDFFAPIGDTRYLVVTPHANAEESAIICLRILHELTTTLLGHCEHAQICIERACAFENDALRTDRFSRQTIQHLAHKADLTELAGDDPAQPDAPRFVQAKSEGLKIVHRFEPVWDARHEAITTYSCVPEALGPNGEILSPFALSTKDRIKIELSALSAGTTQLQRNLERGERYLLNVPVSFDTLGSPYGRMELVGTCRALPAACRQYLVFLITGIPNGVAHSRLMEFVMTLGHFGRIMATVPSGIRNFSAYQGLRLRGIGIDFSAQPEADRAYSDMAQLTAAGRSLRLTTLAYGVNDGRTLAFAHASGISNVHGRAIGAPRRTPMTMTRLHWKELAFVARPEAFGSEMQERRAA